MLQSGIPLLRLSSVTAHFKQEGEMAKDLRHDANVTASGGVFLPFGSGVVWNMECTQPGSFEDHCQEDIFITDFNN